MIKIFKFLLNEFLYNGQLQLLSGASIVYISTLLLDRKPEFFPSFIIYLTFLIIHIHDRYRDVEIDKLTNAVRVKHLSTYLDKIPYLLFLIFAIILVIFFRFGNFLSFVFVITVITFGLLYPVFFKRLTKKVYFFKNIFVSSVYALLVYFPVIYYNLGATSLSHLLSIFIFLECFISQACLDIKDIESDKKEGFLTLPVLFGKEKTLSLLGYASLISLFAFLLSAARTSNLIGFLVIVNFFINQLIFLTLKKGKVLGFFIAPGKFFLWFIAILVVKIFKIWSI